VPRTVPARIWTALLVVYLVWGSTYLAIRIAIETLPRRRHHRRRDADRDRQPAR
jgi:hypothetical protein